MLENKIIGLQGRKADIIGHEDVFKSAVIIPVIKKDAQIQLLFEKRSANITRQPGEICFPGGGTEASDNGARATAVRETCEELGLVPEDIEVIADMDIFVSPFNFIVYPFLAWIDSPQKIYPNPAEVESTFCVPLQFLLDHEPIITSTKVHMNMADNFPVDLIPHGENYPFRTGIFPYFFYRWEGEVIWGITARILKHFIDLIK